MKRALALLFLVLAGAAQGGDEPNIFGGRSDSYDVTWKGITLGSGTITLTPLDAHCFRYESQTRPMSLVRWTYGSPHETSEFCVADGQIVPRHFEYVNDKRRKDNYSLDFDWSAHTVKVIKGGEVRMRELPGPAYDHFLMQQAVRQWVIAHAGDAQPPPAQEFTMVDDDRIKTYRFAIIGREAVDIPAGHFDTIRVERVDNPDKSSRFWVAPSRDYTPVKIEHIEKGAVQLRMELRS